MMSQFINVHFVSLVSSGGFKDTVAWHPLPIAIVLVMALLAALTDIECTFLHLTTSPNLWALSGRPPTCNTTAACATLS